MQNRLNSDDTPLATWRSTFPPPPVTTHTTHTDLLSTYLADIRRTLAGVSDAEAQTILNEIQQHVLASAQGYEELGDTPDAALYNALAAFGAPQELGRSFSTTYQTTGTARSLLPWIAMRRALRVVGSAHALAMSLWLFFTFLAAQQLLPLSFAQVLLWIVLLVIPALAGWRVGTTANTPRASFGTFLALALMTLVSSPLLTVFLHLPANSMPYSELVSLYPLLFVAWLPTACISAGIANLVTQTRAKQLKIAR